jgi:hypothetical protein
VPFVATVVLAAYVFALPLLLFLAWHAGDTSRGAVARLMDRRWGWWHPLILFWKLGRMEGTRGEMWPLWFGVFPFVLYHAAEDWTEIYGPPVDRVSGPS